MRIFKTGGDPQIMLLQKNGIYVSISEVAFGLQAIQVKYAETILTTGNRPRIFLLGERKVWGSGLRV